VLGMWYHAREDILDGMPEWHFEGVKVHIIGSSGLLVYVLVANVQDPEKLFKVLQ